MTARTARLPSCGFKKSADFGDLGNKSSPLLVQSCRDYDSLKFKSSQMGCVCAATYPDIRTLFECPLQAAGCRRSPRHLYFPLPRNQVSI